MQDTISDLGSVGGEGIEIEIKNPEEDESVLLEMWHKEQNDVKPNKNNDVTLDFGGDDVFNIVPT